MKTFKARRVLHSVLLGSFADLVMALGHFPELLMRGINGEVLV